MNRKDILIKIAKRAKERKWSTNTIVVLFAVVILSCYLKDFICKIVGSFFAPFIRIKNRIVAKLSICVKSVYRFCRRHKMGIIRVEALAMIAGFLLLYFLGDSIINKELKQDNIVYGNTGETEKESPTYMEEVESEEVPDVNNTVEENTEHKEENIVIEGKLPYYIELNRLMNTVTIYTYDENGEYTVPVKAMRCATGGDKTPTGTYTISDKFKFAVLSYDSYGQYCTRIIGPYLFHSSTYTALTKDSLSAADFNLLGEPVSHGCVRLTTEDAKWIYDNCAAGTVVTIYDDETTPGPLGKPETIKVPEGTLWDPTDPDENNPWKDKKPEIVGAQDREVFEYDNYNVLDGIQAFDSCGNDVTDKMKITGEVDVNIPGIYTVTYSITDLLGRSDTVTVTITVR